MILFHIPRYDYSIKWKGLKGKIFMRIHPHNKIQVCVNLFFNLLFTKLKVEKHLSFLTLPKTIAIDNLINLNHSNNLSFTLFFFFPEHLHYCYIDFHCSYLYNYYNSSQTLCIKCWDLAFCIEFQHFILRFNKISLLCGYH